MSSHHAPAQHTVEVQHASSVQGTLALGLDPMSLEPPSTPASQATSASSRGADVVDVPDSLRKDLRDWLHTFTQACVEVNGGLRPPSQLLRWATPTIYNELCYRAGVVSRAAVHTSGRGPTRRPIARPQVQSVRMCFLADDLVEYSARVRHGARSRLVAGRLEVIGGRWQATALEFG